MIAYHDTEWGVPVHDERRLFEMLILEGAQAGLAWRTILGKRECYRVVYEGFDPERVARFDAATEARLLADPGIVRNRQKIAASIENARAWLALRDRHGAFAEWLWAFTGGVPVRERFRSIEQVPARSPLSDRISRELVRHGFRFVGSTIVQAFLQAVGVFDHHLTGCFRHGAAARSGPERARRGTGCSTSTS